MNDSRGERGRRIWGWKGRKEEEEEEGGLLFS